MKKFVIIMVIVSLMGSCKTSANCDAYGDLNNNTKDLSFNK